MARFRVDGLDSLIDMMRKYDQTSGAIAEDVLMAGAGAVRDAWRRAADEKDHRVTGDMINSIGFPRSPKDIGGILTIDIYPQGKDSKGIRNAEKAFILHYGSSKLPGSRWVDLADQYSEEMAPAAMQAVFDDYIENGQVPGAAARANAGGGANGGGINRRRG